MRANFLGISSSTWVTASAPEPRSSLSDVRSTSPVSALWSQRLLANIGKRHLQVPLDRANPDYTYT